jgi:hypothetical protein
MFPGKINFGSYCYVGTNTALHEAQIKLQLSLKRNETHHKIYLYITYNISNGVNLFLFVSEENTYLQYRSKIMMEMQ